MSNGFVGPIIMLIQWEKTLKYFGHWTNFLYIPVMSNSAFIYSCCVKQVFLYISVVSNKYSCIFLSCQTGVLMFEHWLVCLFFLFLYIFFMSNKSHFFLEKQVILCILNTNPDFHNTNTLQYFIAGYVKES